MKFSIIIPSYNQPAFIGKTLKNVCELKKNALNRGIEMEVILFDACSGKEVQEIIELYRSQLDKVVIEKDNGQYDAINKGIRCISGEYWTWLNTDDYIDVEGFFKIVEILKKDSSIDYIFGDIEIIDEQDKLLQLAKSYDLSLNDLLNKNPSIFQPGSFFKTSITKKIGELRNNNCCFDYEYILRLLTNKAKFYRCAFVVAQFRLYSSSKSGSIVPVFIREQLIISKEYGRRAFSFMSIFLNLRLIKHALFPR